MMNAHDAAQKWSQRMQQAGQAYTDGVNRVTDNPMQLAAKNVNAYVAGVQQAAASGKWQRGLQRTTLEMWKQKAIALGAQRLGAGATAAQPKVEAFLTQFLPVVQSAQQQVKSMDNSTFEARKARANRMMDLLHAFKRT